MLGTDRLDGWLGPGWFFLAPEGYVGLGSSNESLLWALISYLSWYLDAINVMAVRTVFHWGPLVALTIVVIIASGTLRRLVGIFGLSLFSLLS